MEHSQSGTSNKRKRDSEDSTEVNNDVKRQKINTNLPDETEKRLYLPLLHAWALRGDYEKFHRYFSCENIVVVNVDCVDTMKNTPLMCASMMGHANICNILLDHGANINAQNNRGVTSLHVAINKKEINVVKTLISRGCDIYITTRLKRTPFHVAAQFSQTEIMSLLLHENKKKRDLNVFKLVDVSGETPLHFLSKAAGSEPIQSIVSLLDTLKEDDNVKSAINICNDYGMSPLLSLIDNIIDCHDLIGVDVLFLSMINNFDIDLFISDNRKMNIIHYLSIMRDQNLAIIMMNAIINSLKQKSVANVEIFKLVNQADRFGITPLFISKYIKKNEIFATELLKFGANDICDPRKNYDMQLLNCPICMHTYDDPVVISCGHCFCLSCLQSWRESSNTCPFCRKTVIFNKHEFLSDKLIKRAIKFLLPKQKIDIFVNGDCGNTDPIMNTESADETERYKKMFIKNVEYMNKKKISVDQIVLDKNNSFRIDFTGIMLMEFKLSQDKKILLACCSISILKMEKINQSIREIIYQYICTKLSNPEVNEFFETGNYLQGGGCCLIKNEIKIFQTCPIKTFSNKMFLVNIYSNFKKMAIYHLRAIITSIGYETNFPKSSIDGTVFTSSLAFTNLSYDCKMVETQLDWIKEKYNVLDIVNDVYVFDIYDTSEIFQNVPQNAICCVSHRVLLKYNKMIDRYMIVIVLAEYCEENSTQCIKTLLLKQIEVRFTFHSFLHIMEIDQKRYYCLNLAIAPYRISTKEQFHEYFRTITKITNTLASCIGQ